MDPLPISYPFLTLLMDPFPITSGEAGGYSGSPQRGETYIRVIFGLLMDPLPIIRPFIESSTYKISESLVKF